MVTELQLLKARERLVKAEKKLAIERKKESVQKVKESKYKELQKQKRSKKISKLLKPLSKRLTSKKIFKAEKATLEIKEKEPSKYVPIYFQKEIEDARKQMFFD